MAGYRAAGWAACAALILASGWGGGAATAGTAREGGTCSAGAHTLSAPGSHVYPETGDDGYTSLHTGVHLVYNAAGNRFLPGNHVGGAGRPRITGPGLAGPASTPAAAPGSRLHRSRRARAAGGAGQLRCTGLPGLADLPIGFDSCIKARTAR